MAAHMEQAAPIAGAAWPSFYIFQPDAIKMESWRLA